MNAPRDHDAKLLADARLMAGYAVRLGRLPDKAILAAIERLETTPASDPAYPSALAELSAAMNALAQAIAPVTLMDLGSDWEPYPRHRYDAVIRPMIASFSAVLIAVLAYFSFVYTQARITSGALAALQAEDVAAKSEHLYDHWMTVQSNIPPKSIAQHDDANSYYHEVDVLKSLQDHLDQYTTVANSLFDRSNPATFVVFIGRAVAPHSAAAAVAVPPKPPVTAATATAAGPLVPATPVDANLSLTSSEIAENNDSRPDYKELVSTPIDPIPVPAPAPSHAGAAPPARPTPVNPTADYYNRIALYLSQIGISDIYRDDNNSVENRISTSIRICNDFITIYGLWVLPALYGLFGAMVYHLRSMMNPLIATPNLIAVRGALAMMAGVSISWIFSSLASGANGPAGGITVFGLAFLFGYSIDIFFAALDKVVASVSSWAPKPR